MELISTLERKGNKHFLFTRKMKNVGRSRVETIRGKQRLMRCMGLPIHDGPARQPTKDKMS